MKILIRVIIAVALFVLTFLVLAGISPQPIALLFRLLFAWVAYLKRTLPHVTVNWSGVGMVVLCSVLVLVVGHWLCRWFYQQITLSPDSSDSRPRIWPLRWTIASYVAFWLLFTIVMAASGLARTTAWLFQSGQPFYRVRTSDYADMRMIDGQLATAQLEMSNNVHQIRAAILSNAYGPIVWENYDILWFDGPDDTLRAAIYYPRDPDAQRRIGFRVFGAESFPEEHTMDRLAEVISRVEKSAR